MSVLRRVVVISKEPEIQSRAREVAQEVFAADDLPEALEIISAVGPELLVLDGTLPPGALGACLEQMPLRPSRPCTTVALLPEDSCFSESEYRRAGVEHCLVGAENYDRLRDIAAARAAGPEPAEDENCFLSGTAAAVGLAGRSSAVQKALHMIELVAASQCDPVLVIGETGAGKEVAARAVHHLRRPGQPFVAVNCAALTASLLESELFGHVKGSFTSADRDKTGLLEMAGAGTIFLDEISEMPLDLQAKLLRILQEKTFRKVGGVRDLDCRATIIASSNRDLKKEVREKRFRQDLYYRLNICPIQMVPLRAPQRRPDIPLLAAYFLRTSGICAHRQNRVTAITPLALEALCRHDWPGNVRELRNVIDRAVLLETTDKIGLGSIIIDPLDSDAAPHPGRGRGGKDFSLENAERELIARALHETGWQKTQAAAMLGITRATLYAKVKQYNLSRSGVGPAAGTGPLACPCEGNREEQPLPAGAAC